MRQTATKDAEMPGACNISRKKGTVSGNGLFVESESGRLPIWRSSEEARDPPPADGTQVSFYVKKVGSEDRAADVKEIHTKPTRWIGPAEKRTSSR